MLSQSAAIGISVAAALAAALASMPLSKTPPPDGNTSVAVEPMTHTVRTIPISRLPAPTMVAPAVLPDPVPQAPPELAQHIMPVAPPSSYRCLQEARRLQRGSRPVVALRLQALT